MDRVVTPRVASLYLFLGGGILLSLFYGDNSTPKLGALPLGWPTVFGYVVWLFWFVRMIWPISVQVRKVFWILSSVWHALWLLVSIPFIPYLIALPHWGLRLVVPWAIIGFVTSIVMTRIDSYDSSEDARRQNSK